MSMYSVRLRTKAAICLSPTPSSTTRTGSRSKGIAGFFSRTGFALPDKGSAAYDEALDYTDVQLKIIQQEGYDAHDFNIFDDRAAELWGKPYVDGAVRELTSGDSRSAGDLRRSVEQLMLAANDRKADVRARSFHPAPQQKPRACAGDGSPGF